jgi:4-hydroxy-tetrahydrodipicolinate reductase
MRIAIAGLGITGTQIAEHVLDQDNFSLVAAIVSATSDKIGLDIGECIGRKHIGISITGSDNLAETLQQYRPQVLLDFSSAAFMRQHVETLSTTGVHLVLATTDHSATDLERIKYYTKKYHVGTVMAPNITFGVNVMMELCKIAAKLMPGYDFEIIESHHRYKKDRPSGTAKRIAAKIIEGSYTNSDGIDTVPIHSVRSGGIIGDHKVIICGSHDKIELRHEALSRKAFAEGALWAAQFIATRRGFYLMEDVFTETLFPHTNSSCAKCGSTLTDDPAYAQDFN